MPSDRCQTGADQGGSRLPALAGLWLIILLGLLLRWKHLVNSNFLFDGDDAFIALMASHIAKGRHFPLMWYGQHYMGTLDAYVTGLGFVVFGVSPVVHKLTLLLYAAVAMTLLGWLCRRQWGWPRAWLAVALFAVAPAAIRWQTDATTAYSILFPFAIGLMAVSVHALCLLAKKPADHARTALFGWAGLAGVAFWMESLVISLIIAFPLILWLRRDPIPARTLVIAAGCFLLGITPLVLHNIAYPMATPRTFLGFFLDISSRSQIEEGSILQVLGRGLWMRIDPSVWGMNLLVALRGPGYGPAGILAPAGVGALAIALSLAGSAAVAWVRSARLMGWRAWLKSADGAVLGWLLLSLGLIIVLGATRARYMVLLVALFPLLIVGNWPRALFSRAVQLALAGCLLLYLTAVSLTLNLLHPVPLPNPYPELAGFLEEKGLHYGYADYEIAYPLMLLTQERVIVSPLAGPTILDRYPRHTMAVERAASPFYIYKEEEPLGQTLMAYLRAQDIPFQASVIGRHLVISGLGRAVSPDAFFPPSYAATYQREHYSHPRVIVY